MEVDYSEERRPLLQPGSVSSGKRHVENYEDSLQVPHGCIWRYFLSIFQKISECFHRTFGRNGLTEKIIVGTSAFVANAILFGFRSSLAIYLIEFKSAFPCQDQLVSLAIFLPTGIYGIIGVFTGSFNTKYGIRCSALVGGILMSLGIGISAYVSSVAAIIFYLGIIAGSGTSFIFIAVNCGIATYFDENSKQLMSFISIGGAVGAILFPVFVSKLIDVYSWRGSLLLLCAFTVHLIPCGLLYSVKKIRPKRKPSASSEGRINSNGRSYQSTNKTSQEHFTSTTKMKSYLDQISNDSNTAGCLSPKMNGKQNYSKSHMTSVQDDINVGRENDGHLQEVNGRLSNNDPDHEVEMSQTRILFTMLSDNTYLLLLLSITGAVSFIMSFATILPDYFLNRGLDIEESTRIFVIASIGNIPARFLSSWLLYKNILSAITIFNLSGLIGAALLLLYPYLTSTSMLILLSFMIFVTSGLGLAVFSVTLLEIFDHRIYSCSLGLAMTLSGLGLPVSGYVISALKNRYESYHPCYYFLSLLCYVTILPSLIHYMVTYWKRNRVTI